MGGVFLLLVAVGIGALAYRVGSSSKILSRGLWAATAICALVALTQFGPSSEDSASSPGGTSPDSQGTVTPADAPTYNLSGTVAKPRPAPTAESYEHQRRRQKHEFLATVNESISGAMISGNKFKYVGQNVDLHCQVANIPTQEFFNANCGEDSDGLPAVLVVEYDTTSLSQGQSVRVIGTVEQPMEGTNAFGGSAQFATVKAEFME